MIPSFQGFGGDPLLLIVLMGLIFAVLSEVSLSRFKYPYTLMYCVASWSMYSIVVFTSRQGFIGVFLVFSSYMCPPH